MNRIKNIVIPISVVVLLAVLAGVSFANSQNGKSAVELVFPKKGDITDQLRFSGKIQSEDTFDLGFQVSGKVAKVYVKVGDKVQRGQLLSEINPEEANISYSQAVSDQKAAQAQLEQAKSDMDAQKAKLKSVEKSSTANKYDEKYQKEIKNQSEDNIKVKEALLNKANESVQNARLQAGKTKLYAPIDGTITKQSLEAGEIVYLYTPVISLVGNGTLEIQAYVSEIEVAKISVGDKAKVKIDASQTEDLEATVSAVDPVETNASNISSYKVTLVPSFSMDNLKSGMMVDITLNRGEKKNTLIIPTQSVFEENGKSFVLVEVDGAQIKKEVQLGVNDQEGSVEILSGIGEQDKIVSFNQSK
ncbi:MAG: efflux RND transporter periplasmic adaptor subunit [Candidatus Moraniibacteriota bacterium]